MRLHLFIILHLFFFLSLTGQNTAVIDEGMYQIDTNLKMILTNHDPDHFHSQPDDEEISDIMIDEIYRLTEPVRQFKYGGQYTIINPRTEEEYALYFTQLPIIHVRSSDELSKETRIRGHFFMSEADHSITDELIGVNYRGDWTYRNLPKKSLRIEFWEDVEGIENKNISLLGMRSDDDWNIDAIFNEPLRINSVVGFRLWEAIGSMPHAHLEPEARHDVRLKHVEVFLNGSYHGVCVLSERIDQKQLQIKSFNGQKRGELYKGRENGDFANGFKVAPPYDNDSIEWSGFLMKYPKPDEMIDWKDLFDFVTFVMEADDQEFENQIENYFDIENAVNYLIFVNALRAPDNLQKNIYTARYDAGSPYFFTAWDLDGILGIRYNGTRMPEVHGLYTNELFKRMLRDCRPGGFADRLQKRWKELRKQVITHENFMSLIRENVDYLHKNGVYEREFLTWRDNDLYDYPDGDPASYIRTELAYREDWIRKRLDMMDDIMSSYSRCDHLEAYEGAFITTWKVSSSKNSNKYQIKIPASGDFIYHWHNIEDGTISGSGKGSSATVVELPEPGIYRLIISPDHQNEHPFHRITFKDSEDKDKIINIEQWGDITWSTLENAFHGTENLKVTASDRPDLSKVSDMSYTFYGSAIETIPRLEEWDISRITRMDYLFAQTPYFNQSLLAWDVDHVQSMEGILENASSYNHSLETWQLNNIEGKITLSGSGMSCENYSYTLMGWSQNPQLTSNIILEAENLFYSNDPGFSHSRDTLTDRRHWTILHDSAGDCTDFSSPMITVWETTQTGKTDSLQVEIPAEGQYIYEWIALDEEWNPNGSPHRGRGEGHETITFPEPGKYQISLHPRGDQPLHRLRFKNDGDRNKLIQITQWGNVRWSSLENAFHGAENLEITAKDIPDLSKVTDVSYSFANTRFEQAARMNEWDLSQVKFARAMFEGNPHFNQPIGEWDVSQVISMQDMFRDASAFDQPIGEWDVSRVTTMKNMFRGASRFNQPIGEWEMGKVKDAKGMFRSASAFDQPIAEWDVSQIVDMDNMFRDASQFNQDLSRWNVSSVKIMNSMFRDAILFDQPIGDWNTSQVIDMKSMFENAASFDQPIGDWNVHHVMDMKNMFRDAIQFNQPLNHWNTSRVESMEGMFRNAASFNQPLGSWKVSMVHNMDRIFENATSFDQYLGEWNLTSLTDGSITFSYSGMSCKNYSLTLREWAGKTTTPASVTLKAKGMKFSTDPVIVQHRNYLADVRGWTIKDDGEDDCILCEEPLPIEISVINSTTASISLNEKAQGPWEIVYGPTGFDISEYENFSDVHYDIISSNEYVMTPLTSGSEYDVYLRGECPEEITPDWFGPEGFTVTPTSTLDPHFDEFRFYPNPVATQLNLKASFTITELTIFDLQGKPIMKLSPQSSATIINISTLESGMYYMRVKINQKTKTFRFAKF